MRRLLRVLLGLALCAALSVAAIIAARVAHRLHQVRMYAYAEQVLARIPGAERAWPGYRVLSRPLLLAFDRGSVLIGARRAPRWFLGDPFAPAPIAVSARRFEPSFSYVERFDLDGTTVTAVRVPAGQPPYETARYAIHEHFHEYQHLQFHFEPAAPYPDDDATDLALAAIENLNLADWVAYGKEKYMRDFAAVRLRRRKLFPRTAVETSEERLEGVADFVERAGTEGATSSTTARNDLYWRLIDRDRVFEVRKFRQYPVGAALGRWLDAAGVPDWRKAVESGRAPSELVLERLALSPAEAARRADAVMKSKLFHSGKKAAQREMDQQDALRDEYRARYAKLHGRRLSFDLEPIPGPAFLGTWIDFPGGDQFMIASLWTLDDPVLRFRLSDHKAIWSLRKTHEHEFVVPTGARVTLDGRPWPMRPGRTPFRSFTIEEKRISLAAGPGVLDDDGQRMRLSFPK